MKHSPLYLLFFVIMCAVACSQQATEKDIDNAAATALTDTDPNDRMLHALACLGCNDTFAVVLPLDSLEGSPRKYNILKAMNRHKVIGKLEPGDWCALVINEKDSSVADLVINMDMLKAKWVHLVYPTERDGIRDLLLLENRDMDVDSVIQMYMTPVERGFQLMRHHKASVIGERYITVDENSPVVYPEATKYADWRVVNGQLILSSADSILDEQAKLFVPNKNIERDTFEFALLQKDSLQILYKGKRYDYYRID